MSEELRSDGELMAGICARDASAFEALFARHHEPIRAHLLRTLRDAAAADDLAQEVFLRIWTHAGQWSGAGSFRAWATRIATNLALNHVRTVRRRRELPLEDAAEDEDWEEREAGRSAGSPRPPGPEQAVEELEWRERLQRSLRRLSDEHRAVIRLAHGAELDVREIAERLGIPAGTVRSRLHYARKQLAREWDEEEEETR
ncbi:MAG TPA: RNA polymerase sigma factor [Chthonomonadaceae bacterium]|nr:RNA polymerase sigma factor [Chthonomonadaceae bacterium]